jgi:hypothetical protein
MRKLNARYPYLALTRAESVLANADVRSDFGELVGLVLLEQAVLPNPRGNSYVVTQPRVVSHIQRVMRQFGRAFIDAAGAVAYEAPRQSRGGRGPFSMFATGDAGLLAPGAMGGMMASPEFLLMTPFPPR